MMVMINSDSGKARVSTVAMLNTHCSAAQAWGLGNMLYTNYLAWKCPPLAICKQGQTEDKHFFP